MAMLLWGESSGQPREPDMAARLMRRLVAQAGKRPNDVRSIKVPGAALCRDDPSSRTKFHIRIGIDRRAPRRSSPTFELEAQLVHDPLMAGNWARRHRDHSVHEFEASFRLTQGKKLLCGHA